MPGKRRDRGPVQTIDSGLRADRGPVQHAISTDTITDGSILGNSLFAGLFGSISDGGKFGTRLSVLRNLLATKTEGGVLGESYPVDLATSIEDGSIFSDDFVGLVVQDLFNGIKFSDNLSGIILSILRPEGFKVSDEFFATSSPGLDNGIVLSDAIRSDGLANVRISDGSVLGDSLSTPELSALLVEGLKTGDSFLTSQVAACLDGGRLGEVLLAGLSSLISEGLAASDILLGGLSVLSPEGELMGDSFGGRLGAVVSEGFKFGDSETTVIDALGLQTDGSRLGDSYTAIGDILADLEESSVLGDQSFAGLPGQLSEGGILGETIVGYSSVQSSFLDGAIYSDSYLTRLLPISIVGGIVAGDLWSGDLLHVLQNGKRFSDSFLGDLASEISQGSQFGEIIHATVKSARDEGSVFGTLFAFAFNALGLLADGSILGEQFGTRIDGLGSLSLGCRLGDSFVATTSRITGQILFDAIEISSSLGLGIDLGPRIEFDVAIDPAIKSQIKLSPE